jgi:hypothetical protein
LKKRVGLCFFSHFAFLSQSYSHSHEVSGLTLVDSYLFFLLVFFFRIFFKSFIPQYFFIENFSSLFVQVFLLHNKYSAHDYGHKFQKLTRVDIGFLGHFFKLFLISSFNFILFWYWSSFFFFLFYEVILIMFPLSQG